MKKFMMCTTGVGVAGIGLGLFACGTAPVTVVERAASHSAAPESVKPTATKTVVRYRTVAATPSTPPSTAASAQPVAPAPQLADQNVTDAWAVVSAYYGDIESGNYQQAYALIGDGATTGQSYQEFAAGFTCTGSQAVSENWDSGDQVNFNLAATDSCTGATLYFTGTDTVQNGVIVAADIVQVG